jgi:hypothetical protein
MLQTTPTEVLSNVPTDGLDEDDDVIYIDTFNTSVTNHSIDVRQASTSVPNSIDIYDGNLQYMPITNQTIQNNGL